MANKLFDFCLLNAHSLRKKVLHIKDYVVEHDLDMLAITETWLKSGEKDKYYRREVCPTGCFFHHIPRDDANGGCIGFLAKKKIIFKLENSHKQNSDHSSIWICSWNIPVAASELLLSKDRYYPMKIFFPGENDFPGEFPILLEQLAIASSKLL